MENWSTIAELGTAAGTLILALATFASVRSGNRSAQVAERSLLASIRPLLLPSRDQDPEQEVVFADGHRVVVGGGRSAVQVADQAIYFAISVRNCGPGLAVVQGWSFTDHRIVGPQDPPPLEGFTPATRDMYIAADDVGFWQGAMRGDADARRGPTLAAIDRGQGLTIDVCYTDSDGGQRTVSRFALLPSEDETWRADVSHHWNLDRTDPH